MNLEPCAFGALALGEPRALRVLLASRDVLRGASLSADARWLRSARCGSSLEPPQPRSGKPTRWVGPEVRLAFGQALTTFGLG